jgi:hypothetical protein
MENELQFSDFVPGEKKAGQIVSFDEYFKAFGKLRKIFKLFDGCRLHCQV